MSKEDESAVAAAESADAGQPTTDDAEPAGASIGARASVERVSHACAEPPPVKRGRGRPKGSKNKTTASAASTEDKVPKRRGRPPKVGFHPQCTIIARRADRCDSPSRRTRRRLRSQSVPAAGRPRSASARRTTRRTTTTRTRSTTRTRMRKTLPRPRRNPADPRRTRHKRRTPLASPCARKYRSPCSPLVFILCAIVFISPCHLAPSPRCRFFQTRAWCARFRYSRWKCANTRTRRTNAMYASFTCSHSHLWHAPKPS